jgi:hypothetical protein
MCDPVTIRCGALPATVPAQRRACRSLRAACRLIFSARRLPQADASALKVWRAGRPESMLSRLWSRVAPYLRPENYATDAALQERADMLHLFVLASAHKT